MTEPEPPTWREVLAARLMAECVDARQTLSTLTPRQLEVARHLAKGFSLTQIGERLSIKPQTAGLHLDTARNRLGLQNRVELAVIVAKAGLS